MRGHTSIVSSPIRDLVLVVLFLFGAGLSRAQTPVTVVDKTKVEPSLTAPAVEPLATSARAVTIRPATNLTAPEPDPVRSEAVLMNAAVDEAPKGPPAVSPQEPIPAPVPPVSGAQCKRTIKADVLAMAQPIMLNRLGAAIP